MDSEDDVKLGNKLFDSDEGGETSKLLNLKDPQLARAILE